MPKSLEAVLCVQFVQNIFSRGMKHNGKTKSLGSLDFSKKQAKYIEIEAISYNFDFVW